MRHDFIEKNIVILSRQTLEVFLEQKTPADLIALYCFYYYTAKWQETNQPKASISYCAKGLKWGTGKTRNNKQKLIKLGLIEDVRHIDENTKKVKGWYVKVKYLWKQENHPISSPQGGLSHRVAKSEPNALSAVNSNALSAVNLNPSEANASRENLEVELLGEEGEEIPRRAKKPPRVRGTIPFALFWGLYPRKENQKWTARIWLGLPDDKQAAALADIPKRKATEQWQAENGKFIPSPYKYLTDERWRDEIKEEIKYKPKFYG